MQVCSAQPRLDLPTDADQLGSAVLRNLSRTYRNQFSTSPIRCGILGLFTLGLLPLFRLRRQFTAYITFERQQLWYMAEWLRTRVGGEHASALADYIRQLRYRSGIRLMQNLSLIAMGLIMWRTLPVTNHPLDRILDRTFRFTSLSASQRVDALMIAFVAWNVALAVAYGLHWLQIRRHRRDLEGIIQRFDALARGNGILATAPPIHPPTADLFWPAVGLILAGFGGVWALMMALAGAAQRRYINFTAAGHRVALLEGVRLLQQIPLPDRPVQNYNIHGRRCEHGLCRATLPQGAQFCPRCGTRTALSHVA